MVACADVHRGNAENFAAEYEGKCEIYEDYRKIIDRSDIDAITCGAPITGIPRLPSTCWTPAKTFTVKSD